MTDQKGKWRDFLLNFMVLEIGPRVLHMLGKYFNTGLHTQILKEKDT